MHNIGIVLQNVMAPKGSQPFPTSELYSQSFKFETIDTNSFILLYIIIR